MKRLGGFLLAATTVFVGVPQTNQRSQAFHPLSGAFFIVTKNHYAEGFGPNGPTARFGDLILIGFLDRNQPGGGVHGTQDASQASSYYEKKYFEVGKQFPLFHGGAAVGSVRVEKVVPLQCDSSAAVVSVTGSILLGERDFAIATSAPVFSHNDWQQPPSPRAKEVLDRWVRWYLRNRRRRGDLKVLRRVQTAVDDSKQECLIAELFLKSKGELRSILVVGRITDNHFHPELLRDHRTNDVEDAKDFQPESFVDQIDLDEDRVDEIIVEQTMYESEQFIIYKWNGRAWRKVWIGGQGGC